MNASIDFSVLTSVTNYGADSIKGFLPTGEPVHVTRKLNGWRGEISIFINGVQVHRDYPSPFDQNQYTDLLERSYKAASDEHQLRRTESVKAARAAGLFPQF